MTPARLPPDVVVAAPSSDDYREADGSGVPWFVITDVGVYVAEPDSRVGGLSGPPGYPI